MCPYGEEMCGDEYGCYCQRCWDERTKPLTVCGYCDGSGKTETNPYDREGRDRAPDYPTHQSCEYCGGAGEMVDGDKLLVSSQPRSNPRG